MYNNAGLLVDGCNLAQLTAFTSIQSNVFQLCGSTSCALFLKPKNLLHSYTYDFLTFIITIFNILL